RATYRPPHRTQDAGAFGSPQDDSRLVAAAPSRLVFADQIPVDGDVIASHASVVVALLEDVPAGGPAQGSDAADGLHRRIDVSHDEAGADRAHAPGDRAAGKGDHRRAARHGPDNPHPERLGPVDGEQHSPGIADEFVLVGPADLADVLDEWAGPEQWLDHPL